MTIGELRELIEGLDDNIEVRLAHQPRWAFEYAVSGGAVAVLSDGPDEDDVEAARGIVNDSSEDEEDRNEAKAIIDQDLEATKTSILYLAEGTQIGHLPGAASKAIEWN